LRSFRILLSRSLPNKGKDRNTVETQEKFFIQIPRKAFEFENLSLKYLKDEVYMINKGP